MIRQKNLIKQQMISRKRVNMRDNLTIRNDRRISIVLILLFLTTALYGCAALSSISSFSETSIQAISDKTFFEDYVNIIDRQRELSHESNYAKLDEEKRKRSEQRSAILAFQQNLVQYMKALRGLASDNSISFDNKSDAKTENFKPENYQDGKKIIKSEDIKAFHSLTKLLARISTENYRQNKLKDIIRSADSDFQILVTALINFTKVYIESLETEKSFTANYYETIIKTAETNPPQHAAIVLVRELKNKKLRNLEHKQAEAMKYVHVLQKIADSHNYLNDNVEKISSQQLLATMKGYGKEIAKLYESLKR